MDSSTSIIWSLLFGTIGIGYFIYGKRQRHGTALLSGVALCVFPYLVANIFLVIILGIIFLALPFLIRQ